MTHTPTPWRPLPRNVIIHDDPRFEGRWIAIPREDFDHISKLAPEMVDALRDCLPVWEYLVRQNATPEAVAGWDRVRALLARLQTETK